MREIIFRGKSIDNGERLYGDYAVPTSLYHANIFTKENYLEGVAVDEETVGQYTGLTDKDGRKIFEDDIVEHCNRNYVIRYIEEYMRFAPVRPKTIFCGFNIKQCQIIGNIHDNPELMQSAEPSTQADSWLMSRFQKQE